MNKNTKKKFFGHSKKDKKVELNEEVRDEADGLATFHEPMDPSEAIHLCSNFKVKSQ